MLRQAAWAVGSAPMLARAPGLAFPETSWFADWLDRLGDAFDGWDADPEALASLRTAWEGTPPLLGRRFEVLVGWVLARDPAWEVVRTGWVVADAGQTLGEWDLVLRERVSGRWFHVELACKFYLGVPGPRGVTWCGVNPSDTLEARLASFRGQFQLARSGHGAAQLREEGLRVDVEQVWMKGWWFYPLAGVAGAQPAPGAGSNAPTGWWCRVSDAVAWSLQNPAYWLPLHRLDWLRGGHEQGPGAPGPHPLHPTAPPHPFPPSPLSSDAWARWLQQPLPAPGVLVVQMLETSTGWIELSRGMVVPDVWPNRR